MRGEWIGVFDSGVGGLTVAREILRTLPQTNLAYLGDTARVPYGTRSSQTVRRYAKGCARLLSELGLKALVVACNTASAVALTDLEEELEGPVLGVVRPGAQAAAEATRTGHVAVLSTATTAASGAYGRALTAHAPDIRVTSVSCPLFVPLAEEGWTEGDVPLAVARRYLDALAGSDVDTLVLGCTHYPLLAEVIREAGEEAAGRSLTLVDSAHAVGQELSRRLGDDAWGDGRRRFHVTDGVDAFQRLAPRFLGEPALAVHHVDVRPVES